MRVGTLTKFNRKKNLWISRKHPLYMENLGFKTLYSAAILMHTRLNNTANPFSNFELERMITKGLNLTSKETISMMNLAKDVQFLIDEIVLALDTQQKKLFFLFDLYNVSMSEYNISVNEQKSIDLFADLLEIPYDTKNLILQFISSAYCREYSTCLAIYEQMQDRKWPVTMTDLSYYMLNYSYTHEIYPEDIKNDQTYYFRGNCTFHGTITIPENCTIHIANAIVKIEKNFEVYGGKLIIENSWVDFSGRVKSSEFEHAFIHTHRYSKVQLKNSTFQCFHNGGLLFSSHSSTQVEHSTIRDTSFISAIVAHGEAIHISQCDFKNCFSRQNGGAIFIQKGVAQIQNCNFTNCNSHNGGAIFASDRSVISHCYFENCCAVEFGSAIFYNGEIRSNIEKCDYSNCYPKDDVIIQTIASKRDFTVANETTIRYSTIFTCPILIREYGILNINNASIYLRYPITCNGMLNMKNSKITGLDFDGRDFIAFETPKNCHFTNCEFDGAEKNGIFRAVRARLHIHVCIFRNTANGRAIYNAFLPIIDHCVFSYCQEGAVYCHAGKITNSQFINCRARSGGGIIMYGARGQIEHCHFERCMSNYSGGAIDTSGSYHIVDCTYNDCHPDNVS